MPTVVGSPNKNDAAAAGEEDDALTASMREAAEAEEVEVELSDLEQEQAPPMIPPPEDDDLEQQAPPMMWYEETSTPSKKKKKAKLFQPEEIEDFTHIADEYKAPLFTYPYCTPSTQIMAAYRQQRVAKQRYGNFRAQREGMEHNMAEKLGKLHNLLRESHEREANAKKTLRQKTHAVYETELQEVQVRNQFVDWLARLKAFVKRYKEMPTEQPDLHPLDKPTEYQTESKLLAQWVAEQKSAHAGNDETLVDLVAPHHFASLENLGVEFDLSEEDNWQRSFHQFQLYEKEYWKNPLLIQDTNGDVVHAILVDEQSTSDENKKALQKWCKTQRYLYEQNAPTTMEERYTKLANAGFTFDVMLDDKTWEEHVDLVLAFKTSYGHIHIPKSYVQPNTPADDDSAPKGPQLLEFIDKVRPLIHRDALCPKRRAHLKRVGLYGEFGGRVYEQHVQWCKVGRAERGESQRIKRKFAALAKLAEKEVVVGKKVVKRGDMGKWEAKLDSECFYDSRVFVPVLKPKPLTVCFLCSLSLSKP